MRLKDAECASLADRAADVSPNALLRPVWQDFMLPTVAYVGGPGELAYFAQSAVLYRELLGRMPVMLPRACFTLLDARTEKLMMRFGLKLQDLMVHGEALKERIAGQLVPAALGADFDMVSEAMNSHLERLRERLLAFDPTLAEDRKSTRLNSSHT